MNSEIDRALEALGSSGMLGADIPTVEVMPTESKALNDDILACGGLPRGRIIEVYSLPSAGKCLSSDSLVITDQGIKEIGALCSDELQIEEWADLELTVATRESIQKTSRIFYQGEIPTIRIQTKWGFSLEGGRDQHRVLCLTKEGETEFRLLKELRLGDYVGIRYGTELYGTCDQIGKYKLTEDLAYFIGVLVGDGYVTERGFRITCAKEDEFIVKEIDRIIQQELNLSPLRFNQCKGDHLWVCSKKSPILLEFFKEIPEIVHRSYEKLIPSQILEAPKNIQCAFLSGLFDTDGSVSGRNGAVSLSQNNLPIIKQIRMLLLNLGIVARYDLKKTKWPNRTGTTHRLNIQNNMTKVFASTIGFRLSRKQTRLEREVKDRSTRSGVCERKPYHHDRIKQITGSETFNSKKLTTVTMLQRFLEENKQQNDLKEWQKIKEFIELPIAWFPIEKIEQSKAECWDLEVPVGHNFISDGFISHNSTLCQWLAGQIQNKTWDLKFADGSSISREGTVCWFDAERSLVKDYATASGMDLERVVTPQFGLGNDCLLKLKQAIALDAFDLIVIDSIQAINPDSVADIDGSRSMRDKLAPSIMWAQFFQELQGGFKIRDSKGKLIQSKVPEYVYIEDDNDISSRVPKEKRTFSVHRITSKKCSLIFINHQRTKINTGFSRGPQTYTPGGSTKDFAFSIRLELKQKATKTGKIKGQKILKYREVEIKAGKNKLGIPLRAHTFLFGIDGRLMLDESDLSEIKLDIDSGSTDEENDAISDLKDRIKKNKKDNDEKNKE